MKNLFATLNSKKYILFLLPALIVIMHACKDSKYTINEDLKPVRSPAPEGLFTIYDEALTFKIKGEKKETGGVKLDVKGLYKRFGKIKGFRVFVVGNDGCMKARDFGLEEKTIRVNTSTGEELVVLPQLSDLLNENYEILCRLDRFVKPEVDYRVVDRICQLILCTQNAFDAGELYEKIPELKKFREDLKLEGMQVGGVIPRPGDPPVGGGPEGV